MNGNRTGAETITFLGQLLVSGVAATCVFLATLTLFIPNVVYLNATTTRVIVPVAYLVGSELARGTVFFQLAIIAFHWAVRRGVTMERLDFVTGMTIIWLVTFGGGYFIDLDAGILREYVPSALSEITIPTVILFSVGVVLWTVGHLIDENRSTEGQRSTSDESLGEWLDQHRWLVVARFSGYTLVAACVAIGLTRFVALPLVPEFLARTTPSFLLFAAAVYGFVSSDYVFGTGTMAVGAWITGLAALQYDSATSGVILPMAILLTISATGMVFEDSRLRRNSAETETSPEGF